MVTLIFNVIVSFTLYGLVKSLKGAGKHFSRLHLRTNTVDLESVDTRIKTVGKLNSDLTTFPYWRGGGFGSVGNTPLATFMEENKLVACDADSFVGRLTIYETLMNATPMYRLDNIKNDFGSTTLHFLWGFAAQLEWQCRSGRLIYPQKEPMSNTVHLVASGGLQYYDAIDTKSWWGRMNFALCVPIYKGAERAGIVLPFSTDDIKGSYMDTMEDYEEVVDEWASLWREMISEGGYSSGYDDVEIDKLRCSIWRAHKKTLDKASLLNEKYYNLLPPNEQIFAKGWIRFVEFLVVARWRTDISVINQEGAGYLPRSILFNTDESNSSGEINDDRTILESELSVARERATLAATMDLGASSEFMFDLQLKFMTVVCGNYEARQKFPSLIRAVILRHEDAFWWTKVLPLFSWFIQESL